MLSYHNPEAGVELIDPAPSAASTDTRKRKQPDSKAETGQGKAKRHCAFFQSSPPSSSSGAHSGESSQPQPDENHQQAREIVDLLYKLTKIKPPEELLRFINEKNLLKRVPEIRTTHEKLQGLFGNSSGTKSGRRGDQRARVVKQLKQILFKHLIEELDPVSGNQPLASLLNQLRRTKERHEDCKQRAEFIEKVIKNKSKYSHLATLEALTAYPRESASLSANLDPDERRKAYNRQAQKRTLNGKKIIAAHLAYLVEQIHTLLHAAPAVEAKAAVLQSASNSSSSGPALRMPAPREAPRTSPTLLGTPFAPALTRPLPAETMARPEGMEETAVLQLPGPTPASPDERSSFNREEPSLDLLQQAQNGLASERLGQAEAEQDLGHILKNPKAMLSFDFGEPETTTAQPPASPLAANSLFSFDFREGGVSEPGSGLWGRRSASPKR